MNINKLKILLLSMLIVLATNCKGKDMDKRDIKWEAGISAPAEYPVMVFGGIFTYPEEGGLDIIQEDITTNDWGTRGGGSMGMTSSRAPDGVGIKWYSYVEDKFYTGFFDLPMDTIQSLLSQTLVGADTKIPDGYNRIIVGMAPRGVVSVWLYGDGYATEIGSFKADETDDIDIGDYNSSLKFYYEDWTDRKAALADKRKRMAEESPSLFTRIQSNKPIPEGLWDKKYREKFDFKVQFNFADPKAIPDMMTMHFINGEAETLVYEAMRDNASKKRARITGLKFMWSFDRELRESEQVFDKDEIMEAYRLIYQDEDPGMPCELRVDVNEENTYIRVYLQAVGTEYPKEVELLKSKIIIYPTRETYRFIYDVFRHEYEEDDIMLRKDRKKE